MPGGGGGVKPLEPFLLCWFHCVT